MINVSITVIYNWRDSDTSISNYMPLSYGVTQNIPTYSQGGPLHGTAVYFIKPSYYGLYETAYSLNGYTFSQRVNATPYLPPALSSSSFSVYLLKFVKGSSVRYALWSAGGAMALTLPESLFNSTSITVTTIFGSSTSMTGSSFNVTASGTPEFIS